LEAVRIPSSAVVVLAAADLVVVQAVVAQAVAPAAVDSKKIKTHRGIRYSYQVPRFCKLSPNYLELNRIILIFAIEKYKIVC
jgi:hypothetical protein